MLGGRYDESLAVEDSLFSFDLGGVAEIPVHVGVLVGVCLTLKNPESGVVKLVAESPD